MKIYLIINDLPQEQGGIVIMKGMTTAKKAREYVNKLKIDDPYNNQYTKHIPLEIE